MMRLSDPTVGSQTLTTGVDVLVGLAVLAWICSRQLRRRPVRDASWRAPAILAVVGLVQCGQALGKLGPDHRLPVVGVAVLLLGIVVGAGLAVLRGSQVRVWRESDGTVVRQGTPLTIALWVGAVAIHLGVDLVVSHLDPQLKGVGSASLLLYLGVVLGVQQLVVARRAALLPTGAPGLAAARPA